MGERKFRGAQNYYQDWFKLINKFSLLKISKVDFDYRCSLIHLQSTEHKVSWNFIK